MHVPSQQRAKIAIDVSSWIIFDRCQWGRHYAPKDSRFSDFRSLGADGWSATDFRLEPVAKHTRRNWTLARSG
jgi:hypothetical protein